MNTCTKHFKRKFSKWYLTMIIIYQAKDNKKLLNYCSSPLLVKMNIYFPKPKYLLKYITKMSLNTCERLYSKENQWTESVLILITKNVISSIPDKSLKFRVQRQSKIIYQTNKFCDWYIIHSLWVKQFKSFHKSSKMFIKTA